MTVSPCKDDRLFNKNQRLTAHSPWRTIPLGILLGAGFLFVGCLYDSKDTCGEKQLLKDEVCICEDGHALINRVCVACGENEIPGDGECVCDIGFSPDATGACGNSIDGLGDACDAEKPCPSTGATFCVSDTRGDYCSVPDCEGSADCPDTYGCETDLEDATSGVGGGPGGSPANTSDVCVQGPTGFATSCSEQSDCEEFEASYCETFQEKVCMQECVSNPGICHGDWACCDFRSLIGAAFCVSPTEFNDEGQCPLGVPTLEAGQ